jgi:hypothetical protein
MSLLSSAEADQYAQELHPAFAGYLLYGEVNELAVVAAIFRCIEKGMITPEFANNDIRQPIRNLIRTQEKPQFLFEEIMLFRLFNNQRSVSTGQVCKLIKSGKIQKLITEHMDVILQFPIINQDLQFSERGVPVTFTMNGNTVNTLGEAKQMKIMLEHLFLPIFTVVGLIPIILLGAPGLLFGTLFIGTPWFIYWSLLKSQKKVDYDFKNRVVPKVRPYYMDLYTFLKKNPLPSGRITNFFLSHAIAFGLDTSRMKDFNLKEDFKLEFSST